MKKTDKPNSGAITRRHLSWVAVFALIVASSFVSLSGRAMATPTGGTVVGGAAAISQIGNTTTINQESLRAIIDWRSFNINPNELVKFIQPGRDAAALNRITGGGPTTILGQLAANGRVFIVNPNGVIFGAGSRVDVAGLLATTFDIDNADFMAGRYNFLQNPQIDPSFVINQGEIRIADNGFVFLVAPGVKNEGAIIAQLGKVVLASGTGLTIDFNGDGLITYNISGRVLESVKGPDGKPFSASVSNEGTISAPGGQVALVGRAVRDAFSSVVNNSGVIEARSLVVNRGSVSLLGGDEGIVQNTGLIDVSAAEAGAKSGEVNIAGEFAGNFGAILARGAADAPGGKVTFNSTIQTLIGSDSLIDVSGGNNSSAGTVLIHSDNRATFLGLVLARGGETGGDGGFVDVSSKPGQVEFWGQVDASAPHGVLGTLLIDPKFIIIQNAGGVPYDATDDVRNNRFTDAPADITTITATSINAQTAAVVLQANTDITVTDAINMTTAGVGLTLQAGRSVLVNANIATNNGAILIRANDPDAISAQRDPGPGNIVMAAGTTISAGNALINLTIGTGPEPGGITTDTITTTGTVTLNSFGSITRSGAGVISGAGITLNVTGGPAATIGIDTNVLLINATGPLSLTTVGGSAFLEDTAGGVAVGAITIGTGAGTGVLPGTLILTATNGAITRSDDTRITAGSVVLVTAGVTGGAIGTSADPIQTRAQILTASTNDGGIFIREHDGVLINSVIARESLFPGHRGGVGPLPDGDDRVILRDVRILPGGEIIESSRPGTFNVVINAGGDVVVGTVNAPNKATLTTTGGRILDGNREDNNFTARELILRNTAIPPAPPPADPPLIPVGYIGHQTDRLEGIFESVDISSTSGSIYLTAQIPSVLTSISAGSGQTVIVSGMRGAFRLGAISAPNGTVRLTSEAGTLVRNPGSGINITASRAELLARDAIGSSADPIETTVTALTTETTALAGGTFVTSTGAFTTLGAKTNRGLVTITGAGVTGLTFVTLSTEQIPRLLNANAATAITFETPGNISLGRIDAGAGTATITAVVAPAPDPAPGNITRSPVTPLLTALTAGTATLTAAGAIGAIGAPLFIDVDNLTATAAGGGIFITNAGDLSLTSAIATGGDISVRTTTTTTRGDLTLGVVSAAGRTVTLTVAGQLIAGIGTPAVPGTPHIPATEDTPEILATPGTPAILANKITAATATLTATAIGMPDAPIETTVSNMTATASAGGIFLANTGTLNLTNATATDGDISLTTTGDLTLGLVSAEGKTVTLTVAGRLIDGNIAANNIIAATASISAAQIGAPGTPGPPITPIDFIETMVSVFANLSTTAGGIYVNNTGAILRLESVASRGDVHIVNALGINLGVISAEGHNVTLRATTGAILDVGDPDIDVSARSLTISAPGDIGTSGNPLEIAVGELNTSRGHITNLIPVALGRTTFTEAPSDIVILAPAITILDLGATPAVIPLGRSLTLITPGRTTVNFHGIPTTFAGNIVFLNPANTIATTGGGSITIDAGHGTESGAVAVLGNLRTEGGAITIKADSHISFGVLDARTVASRTASAVALTDGKVTVLSDRGQLLTNNSTGPSIIAGSLELSGNTPFEREADRHESSSLREEVFWAGAYSAANISVLGALLEVDGLNTKRLSAVAAKTAAEAELARLTPLYYIALGALVAAEVLHGTLQVGIGIADAARFVLATIAAVAQAVPFTGDGGTATAAVLLEGGVMLAEAALFVFEQTVLRGASIAYDLASSAKDSASVTLEISKTARDLAVASHEAAQQSYVFMKGARDRFDILSQAAKQVYVQAIQANAFTGRAYSANAIGSPGQPLHVWVPGRMDIKSTGDIGNIYLHATGPATLGTISAANYDGNAKLFFTGTGNVTIAGNVTTENLVRIDVSGAANRIIHGGGTIIAPGFVATAPGGIGTSSSPIQTQIDRFAASGGAGGVSIANDRPLLITTLGGVTGVTATGGISSISTSNGNITLERLIDAGAGAVLLNAGAGAILDNNLTPFDIKALSLGITAAGGIAAAGDPLETEVSNFEAQVIAGNIYLNNQAATLNIGGVSDTLAGVDTETAGIIDIATTGALTVTEGISTAAGGAINLVAAGTVTLGNNMVSTGTTGATVIRTSAGNIVGAAGSANITTGTLTLEASAAGASVGAAAVALPIDAVTLNVTTGGGNINIVDTAGGVAVGLVTAGAGDVTLTAIEGSITESGSDINADIVGGTINLVVTGAGTVGTVSETLEINATTLNVTTEGGSIFLTDTADGVAVGLVTADTGDVTLTATGGSITEAGSDINADIVGATINLVVTGAASAVGASLETLEINAINLNVTTAGGNIYLTDTAGGVAVGLVTAGAGNVTLTAIEGSITEAGSDINADIVGGTINLVVTGAGTVGTVSETLEINTTNLYVTTEGGNIYLTDTLGGVAVGLVTAVTGDVTLTATGGSITEAAIADDAADIVGGTINLVVTGAGTVGAGANPLELDASILNVTTAGGGIYLTDTAGGVAVGLVTAGAGNVTLTAMEGSLTEAGSDDMADIIGNTINLVVTGAGNTIGAGDNPIEIDAAISTLNAKTDGGNIYLTDVAGGLGLGLVDAGSGDVSLTAVGGSIIPSGLGPEYGVTGSTVNLLVTGPDSTIGAPSNILHFSAATTNFQTGGGAIFIYTVGMERLLVAEIDIPALIARDYHLLGGTTIDRVWRAQSALNPYQLLLHVLFDEEFPPQPFYIEDVERITGEASPVTPG